MSAARPILPLFPLGHVLMPGSPLPLRIFEPRYRRMLADMTQPGVRQGFGVVALTAGLEVDTGLDDNDPQFASIGTVAEVLQIEQAADGTAALLAVGSERFHIIRLVDTAAPYLQAEVEFLDEPVGPLPAALPGAAQALAVEYARLLHRLTGGQLSDEPYPSDAIALSYRLATEAPLSPEDRQQLLADESATTRLTRIQRLLRREVALLRHTRTIAVAPSVLQAALRPN